MFAQTQFEEPYSLRVPVALFYEGETVPQIYDISLTQKTEGVIAEEFGRLQAVLVDPFFDVFRALDRGGDPAHGRRAVRCGRNCLRSAFRG